MVSPIIISKTLDQAASRTDLWNAKKSTIEKEQQKSKTGVEAEEKVVEMSFGVVVFFFSHVSFCQKIFLCVFVRPIYRARRVFAEEVEGILGGLVFFFTLAICL